MYKKLQNTKGQDVEVAIYLRPGQFVYFKFYPNERKTEVFSISSPKSRLGEIEGRVDAKYGEIKSYEPYKSSRTFEFNLLYGIRKKEVLEKELMFLKDEIKKLSLVRVSNDKKRKRNYAIWANSIMRRLVKIEATKRKIESIYHVTCIENLKSILTVGLLSRDKLTSQKIKHIYNDLYRRDGYKNAISCSISHPNYFYLNRKKQKNPSQKWCIIEVKAEILWKRKCYFSDTNAASSVVTMRDESERFGVEPFKKMFNYSVRNSTREVLRQSDLPSRYPTDIQAEVLVFGDIKVSNIKGIHFFSNEELELVEFNNQDLRIPLKISQALFQHWDKNMVFGGV